MQRMSLREGQGVGVGVGVGVGRTTSDTCKGKDEGSNGDEDEGLTHSCRRPVSFTISVGIVPFMPMPYKFLETTE